jgi:hypothetical protein
MVIENFTQKSSSTVNLENSEKFKENCVKNHCEEDPVLTV